MTDPEVDFIAICGVATQLQVFVRLLTLAILKKARSPCTSIFSRGLRNFPIESFEGGVLFLVLTNPMGVQGLSTIQVTQSFALHYRLGYLMDIFLAEGGVPFVCGGYSDSSTVIDFCHKYVATTDEWVLSGTLAEARGLSGYGSSESWGLVMAGGSEGDPPNYLSIVESTYNGETFGRLPDLEFDNRESCLVVVDDDMIFTCGGQQQLSTETFIFSNTTNLWSRYT